MKKATYNTISSPSEGWSTDENGRMTIDYFDGDPFPKNITDLVPQSDDEDFDDLTDAYDLCESDSTSSEDETEDDN